MRRLLPALGLLGLMLSHAMAAPVLEKVVILQRHGVRAPTKAPADLAPAATQPWAAWPVGPGELTDHGAAALLRMGEALHRRYGVLLPPGDCTRVFVWADNADQRTRLSGNTMAAALAPGCNATAQWLKGDDDPLFHGDDICPADGKAAQAAVAARLDGVIAAHSKTYDTARLALTAILNPGLSAQGCNDDRRCALLNDTNAVKKGGRLSGTLAEASSLTENLYLEYAQGMMAPGWGRMSRESDVAAIMPLHEMASDLTRRTPLLAAHNGTLLAHRIEEALTGAPPAHGMAPLPADARLVLLAGHDTNLSNIAAMLGLDWTLPGQPDITAPDTALAFELWQDGGKKFVRVRLFYQTLAQLRDLTPLRMPPHRDLAIPGCDHDCTVERMSATLEAAMAPECLAVP